jgi:hypothetical protein
LACGLARASASTLSAQGPDEPARGFVSLGGGFQFASRTSTDAGTFLLHDETGSFTGERKVANAPFFDIAGGAHVSGKLSAGLAFSRLSKGSDTTFTVLAPHPLFEGELRTVALNVNDLGHTETAVHLQAIWQLLTSSRYDASVFGGPSIVHVKEDTVTAVTATETGSPFTAVNLNATFGSASKTSLGVNVGLDFNYHVTGGIGAGAFFRYTVASAKLPTGESGTRKVTLGGPQLGFGLRYRF